MPTEPKGKRRPTDMSGNAIRVAQIATGEVVRRQAREERGRRRTRAQAGPLAPGPWRRRRGLRSPEGGPEAMGDSGERTTAGRALTISGS
jgi:hypothetical protein